MPAYGKRRRGKAASARASSRPPSSVAAAAATTSTTTAALEGAPSTPFSTGGGKANNNSNKDTTATPLDLAAATSTATTSTLGLSHISSSNRISSINNHPSQQQQQNDLILTSEKRRGVYECDYCRSDISQLPRVRCAVCVDFDLCLDCFATTKAAATTPATAAAVSGTPRRWLTDAGTTTTTATAAADHTSGNSINPTIHNSYSGAAAGPADAVTATAGTIVVRHDSTTHGYRVCDSTRYPLFPTSRAIATASVVAVMPTATPAAAAATPPNTVMTRNSATVASATEATASITTTVVPPAADVHVSSIGNDSANPSVETTASAVATADNREWEHIRRNVYDVVETGVDGTAEEVMADADAKQQQQQHQSLKQDASHSAHDTDSARDVQTLPQGKGETTKESGCLTKNVISRDETQPTSKSDPLHHYSSTKETPFISGNNEMTTSTMPAVASAPTVLFADVTMLFLPAAEDPKSVWTVEEDLRLLEGIRANGLGNWTEISEAVSGQGSTGKTPKRCMERYFDDFLGRFGYILPPYTLIAQDDEESINTNKNAATTASSTATSATAAAPRDGAASVTAETESNTDADSTTNTNNNAAEDETPRASKRRAVLFRTPNASSSNSNSRKKYKATLTESLPEVADQHLWPYPYLPKVNGVAVHLGQEVGREQAYKAEQAFVRTIATLDGKDQVERVRREWQETRLNQPGGPTALPMRPDDVMTLPGSDLAGFMPRRGDFDVEWENEAEQAVADMEFLPGEPAQDRQLKLQVLEIYNRKLDEREQRKQFVLSRHLYDYRRHQADMQRLPRDERDLILRMRLFERFHTPDEHKTFIADLLKAKRLRKEIAKLQMYRRMGIHTLAEAEEYELDRRRRQIHKTAYQQNDGSKKSSDTAAVIAAAASGGSAPTTGGGGADAPTKTMTAAQQQGTAVESTPASLWKQYRTTDRKNRKSINRGSKVEGLTDLNNSRPGTPDNDGGDQVAASATAAASSTATTSAILEVETLAPPGTSTDAAHGHDSLASSITEQQQVQHKQQHHHQQLQMMSSHSLHHHHDQQVGLDQLPGAHLLSTREMELCHHLRLTPAQYVEIKGALLYESLSQGLLDRGSGPGVNRRTLVMIDTERRGEIIDFMVRSGWITAKGGGSAGGRSFVNT